MSLFLRIENRNNFLIKEFPKIHPQSSKYISFWREQKRRVIEGFWSPDDKDVKVDTLKTPCKNPNMSNKWRYMPSNLYFYVNMAAILHRPKGMPKTSPKIVIRPFLRDIEWEFFYNWAECRGFSGFLNDEEYSCSLLLSEDGISDEELINESLDIDGNRVDAIYYNFFNKKNERKQYISAREYLRKLHNRPLGLALYNNEARNLLILSARGGG